VTNPRNQFRLNIGFIIHETVGYSRDFEFDLPGVHLPPDLDLADVIGTARVTRTAQGLLVQVRMAGTTITECSRCLGEASQRLEIDFTELYAFTPNSVTESGLYVPETGILDLAPIVREEMVLATPINALCRPDCKGLCPVCGENLNENPHTHDEPPADPRLEGLRQLLDKGPAGEEG
jgi:uncharacterized protein